MNELCDRSINLKTLHNSGILRPFLDKAREINNDSSISEAHRDYLIKELEIIFDDFLSEYYISIRGMYDLRLMK